MKRKNSNSPGCPGWLLITVLVLGMLLISGCNGSTPLGSGTISDETVNIKEILGIDIPVVGEVPVDVITPNTQFTGTVSWDPDDDPFKVETVYTATITLTANPGFTLTGVGANFFTVEGASASNEAGSGVITAVFLKTSSCEHPPVWTVNVPATCEEEGEEESTCNDCSVTSTRNIPAHGHDWDDWEIDIPAACGIPGEETRVCKHDPAHIEERVIPALVHDWGNWEFDPPATCGADGLETRVCGHDPAHTEENIIPATGLHSWSDWIVITPPTTTTLGSERRICSVCGDDQTQEIDMVPIVTITFLFYGNGGTWDNGLSNYSSVPFLTGEIVEAPVPLNDMHIFNGWFTAPQGGTFVDVSSPINWVPPGNALHLYAQWTFSADEVRKYLEDHDSGDDESDPIHLPLSINLGNMPAPGSLWLELLQIIEDVGKYVNLDLEQSSITGEVFDPVPTVRTGKRFIVELTLPYSVENIAGGTGAAEVQSAFRYFDNLTSIKGEYITSIGNYAFTGRDLLKKADFLNLEEIGTGAFRGCVSLEEVEFWKLETLGSSAFLGCTNLERAVMPNLISIGDHAFNGCSALQAADYQRATSIGANAFARTSHLTEVYISEALTIGQEAFLESGITMAVFPLVTEIALGVFDGCEDLMYVEMPEVTKVGNRAFRGCTSLSYVYMPEVTSLGTSAFGGCLELTEVDFPLLTSIGNNTFAGTGLISVDFPLLTSIGNYSFANNSSLADVSLPSLAMVPSTLGQNTFHNNTALTSVYLPKLTSLSERFFEGCTLLETIDMPELVSIGQWAIVNCYALETVIFPKLTTVGNTAFTNSNALTSITIAAGANISGNHGGGRFGAFRTYYVDTADRASGTYTWADGWTGP